MYNRQHRIQINYLPLQTSGAIEVVGSVPGTQVYQADKQEYTPDYTLTPLTLFPRCNATDPDNLVKLGSVNAKLTNMKWYETVNGTRTLITSDNASYTITTDGTQKGQILVKKNVSTIQPVTLEFYAEYVDAGRSGQTYVFRYTYLIRSVDGSEATPSLMIDSPSGMDWNPLRDRTEQTITAKLIVADVDVTDTDKCRFFFYRVLSTGSLELITGTGDNDWEVVSITKNTLTIDRNYIGTEQRYVVKASYSHEGAAPEQPDDAIAPATTAIRRRIPALEIDWEGVPEAVPAGTTTIYPRVLIRDTKGTLSGALAEEILKCTWLRQLKGAAYASEVAQGWTPEIPMTEGMSLTLEVSDRGAYAAMTDDAGKYITDANGKLIMARKPNE